MKRSFSYLTVGKVLDELEAENIKITRVNYYRLEKRLKFPVPQRTSATLKWRVYTREQVEEIKNKIKSEYNLKGQAPKIIKPQQYQIIIPNDPTDYEDTCEADNIPEAAEIFAKRINGALNEDAWSVQDLVQYISEVPR
mgnify:CR=1 FL=1